MIPLETESATTPRRRLHPLAARTLLWSALALLVAVQFLDWPRGRVGQTWLILADMISSSRHRGWAAFNQPPEWIGSFVTAHVSIVAAPWLARVLAGHALLLWLARIFSMAASGALVWCVFSTNPVWVIYDYEIPIWAGCLVLPSFLNAAGLCLLPGRKSRAGERRHPHTLTERSTVSSDH